MLTLLPEAVWNSVVSVATKNRQFLRAIRLGWSHFLSLCDLPLRGWAVVAPRHVHFTITALTVDWGSSSRAEIVGNVPSYDGAMLKVTDLFSKAILLPMFVYGDCMAVCSILSTCQQWVWLK